MKLKTIIFLIFIFGLFLSNVSADQLKNVPSISWQDTISGEINDLNNYYSESKESTERQYKILLAEATGQDPNAIPADDPAQKEKCAKFGTDLDADIGEILRAGCQPTTAQMSALMDNPLGNVAMMFNQFDNYHMKNDANNKEAIQNNYMMLFQFPKKLNENWNLINRVVLNLPSAPLDQDKINNFGYGTAPGGGPSAGSPPAAIDLFDGRTTGFGDMYYVGLFSPADPIEHKSLKGKSVVGAGFDLGFPTASEDVLGTGRWTSGPSALYAYLGPKWKMGGLVQQYWDLGGDNDFSDVNITNIQYLLYYSINETTSIGAAPNIIANWQQDSGDVWTVPIGIGINKTIQMGKIPVRIGVEAFYSVVRPDDVPGTDWSLRWYFIPAIPSAMFKWMG